MAFPIGQAPAPDIMDIRQMSRYLHLSADTIYLYASTGKIPAFKLGNRWRFRKVKIDEWIDAECKRVEVKAQRHLPTQELVDRE